MGHVRSSLALLALFKGVAGSHLREGSSGRPDDADLFVSHNHPPSVHQRRHLQVDVEALVGCYSDSGEYSVMDFGFISAEVTVEQCWAHCADKSSTFMGLKDGFQCLCGSDEEAEYTVNGADEEGCEVACNGGGSDCGGPEAISLYRMLDATDPADGESTEEDPVEEEEPVADSTEEELSPVPEDSTEEDPLPMPAPEDSAEEEEDDTGDSPSPGGGGDPVPADMQRWLDLHNEARCKHGAEPLVWSNAVASSADSWNSVLTERCSGLEHSDRDQRNGFGENLAMCGGGECSADQMMEMLYDDEITCGSVSCYEGHATQILWKSTKMLGVSKGVCDGGSTFFTLQYEPAGNYMAIVEEEVGPLGSGTC